jgi:hypothetical protein
MSLTHHTASRSEALLRLKLGSAILSLVMGATFILSLAPRL